MDTYAIEKAVGSTTVSPDVLHKIARLTTLSVQGVSRMANVHCTLDKIFGKEDCQGTKVVIKDGKVFVDIYVVLMSNMNVREISREIRITGITVNLRYGWYGCRWGKCSYHRH